MMTPPAHGRREKPNRLAHVLYAVLMALALFSGAGNARADACTVTMSDVNFGAVSPLSSTDITVSATGTVTCAWNLLSPTPPYLVLFPNASICVNIGLGDGSVSLAPRTLTNGSAKLNYNLYRSATMDDASIVGSSTLPTVSLPILSILTVPLLTGGSITQNFTVWGKIPAGAALAAVPTVGNADTNYISSFAGYASINYSFYNLIQPACTASGLTSNFSFTARARVVNDCRINSAPLAFGTVGALTGAVRSTSALSVQCVNNNAYQVALNGGTVAANVAARKMKSAGGGLVAYRLSTTLDGPLWGDGSAGTAVFSGVGTGATVSVPMYGMVPVQSTPAPGDFRDTVTATVLF